MAFDGSKSILTCKAPAAPGRYFYWVTVTNNKDTNDDGDTDDPGEKMSVDSALAVAKVVDRTLFDSVLHGDFEDYYNSFIKENNAGDSGFPPSKGYWNTTHEGSPFNTSGYTPTGKLFQFMEAIAGGAGNDSNRVIELSNFYPNSIYQEVATVPGKVYEWSMQHAALQYTGSGSSNLPDVIALVVGPAINEESDYTDMGVTNYWNKVDSTEFNNVSITTKKSEWYKPPFTYSYGASPTEVCPTCALPQYGGAYNYGVNMNTHFNAIVNQVLLESGLTAADYNANYGVNFNDTDRAYATTYGGKPYYVFISASPRTTKQWYTRAGAYTVPAGQGTTVFGYVSVSSPVGIDRGNLLDNITFKSGTDLGASADTTYTGETKLSAPTQTGFAYGLAEVRGSSLQELTGLEAYYDPDGTGPEPEQSVTPASGLGTGGWYTKAGGTPFAGSAVADPAPTDVPTITFKNLTPGKTYRIVGLPSGAISAGLKTNLNPADVLDDGYYSDSRISPASGGGATALPSYNMETYLIGAGEQNRRARVTLKNTYSTAEYALLAEDGSGGVPDTGGPALPGKGPAGTAWTDGSSGSVVFEGLHLGKKYYLVARPKDYTEIGYAEAAYMEGSPAWVEIATPAGTTRDVVPADITRAANGSSITVKLDLEREPYTYAVADAVTGELAGDPVDASDVMGMDPLQITFSDLSPTKAYQVVTKLTDGGTYLGGVLVYPYPVSLAEDYANDAIRPTDRSVNLIPESTEYTIRPSGRDDLYFVGEAPTSTLGAVYRRGNGRTAISLTDPTVVPRSVVTPSALGTLSLFDALKAANAGPDFVISYRHSPGETTYKGPYILPEYTLKVSGQPSAPSSSDYDVDFAGEKVTAKTTIDAILPGADPQRVSAGAGVTFGELGWADGAPQTVTLRKPYTSAAFASAGADLIIPARAPAPEGLDATLIDASDPSAGIILSGFADDQDYEYRRGASGDWTKIKAGDLAASSGAIKLPYDTGSGDYIVRYPSTGSAPASFYATVSSPLNLSAVNFGSRTYSKDVPIEARPVVIRSIVNADIGLDKTQVGGWNTASIRITGTDAEKFSLNQTTGVTIGGLAMNTTAYAITPNTGLDAGNYSATVEVRYNYSYTEAPATPYIATANIYLTVEKAAWDMSSVSGTVGAIQAGGFGVDVKNAPTGANLLYFLDGETVNTNAVEARAYSFTGLQPAHTYDVYVKAGGDKNHIESQSVYIATAHTLQATPNAASVIRIDYVNEKMTFRTETGISASDYIVRVNDAQNGNELTNDASLTNLADTASFTLNVMRRASGLYGRSEPSTISLEKRGEAPEEGAGGVTIQNSTKGKNIDGKINLAGVFQYRPSGSADVTVGWRTATDSATVSAGYYDVRRPPTDTAFASAYRTVRVKAMQPQVTLHTKTYGPGADKLQPAGILGVVQEGWTPLSGTSQQGQYQKDKTTAALDLPPKSEVKSRSHVFQGWYDNANLTGSSYASAPQEATPDNYDYYAKWVVRPQISSVATSDGAITTEAGIEADAVTATQGLSSQTPAEVNIHLAPGDTTLSLADIVLIGQSDETGKEAQLYSDAGFTTLAAGNVSIDWMPRPKTMSLITTSKDDDNDTKVYYRLYVYTTRIVTFTSEQTGGASGVKTSTGINISFREGSGADEANVNGFTSGSVALTPATGSAVGGALSGELSKYVLAVTDVSPGAVGVRISDWTGYAVTPSSVYAELYRDSTPPTAAVGFRGNFFSQFLNQVTFGLFFKDTVDVTVSPADKNGDGVARTESFLLTGSFESEDAFLRAVVSENLQPETVREGAGDLSFSVEAKRKGAVYAKVTDLAGNVAVVNSAGMVVYTDSGAAGDVRELTHVRMSESSATASVSYHGNSIEKIRNDMGTSVDTSDDEDLVRGRDYEASGERTTQGAVTFNESWLNSLTSSDVVGAPYTLTLSYDPLGVSESPSAGALGTDTPTETSIALTVRKARSSVYLTATKDPVYGPGNVTLKSSVETTESSVTAPEDAGGKVKFYKGTGDGDLLGEANLVNGEASLSVTMSAASYPDIRADYGGDANYEAGAAALGAYAVAKANQPAVSVKNSSGASITEQTKTRGDAPFALTASGGAGTGAWTWTSSDPSVATLAVADTAIVTIHKAGVATIAAVRPGDGNYEDSSPANVFLTVEEERTPPAPGGALTASAIKQTSLSLSWKAATDNLTEQNDIKYYVYIDDNFTNDLDTPARCASNGAVVTSGAGLTSYDVNGLKPVTTYWLNVVAEDEAGNRSAYEAVRVITPVTVKVVSAVQSGGKNGRLATDGVLLTFDRPVENLTMEDLRVSGPAAQSNPVFQPGTNGAIWLYPVKLSPGAINGEKATVTVKSWTADNGHRYDLSGGAASVDVTLYVPSPWPTPSAFVDYEDACVANLSPGGFYQFDAGSGFAGEREIDSTGTYAIPFNRFGVNVDIVRVGVTSGAVLGDDEPGRTDSAAQTLIIPGRPTGPAIETADPESEGGTGAVTVTNPVPNRAYEWTKGVPATTEGAYVPSATWTAIPGTTDPTLTVSGISPGVCFIRVKATETSFASAATSFRIFAYQSIGFSGALEGYEVGTGAGMVAPCWVGPTVDERAATAVTLSGVGAGNFKVDKKTSGSATVFYVLPKEDLAPGCYTATAEVAYTNVAYTSERDVAFEVYPHAVFTDSAGAVASSSALGGPTDSLTLHFKYGIDLAYGDIVLRGAVNKASGATTFTKVSADKKTYVVPVSPILSHKTGDGIEVIVKLDADKYAVQIERQGLGNAASISPSTPPSVVIPRAIAEARALPAIPGYATGMIQFTLDKNQSPVTDPLALVWNALDDTPESCPVSLGGEAKAAINNVFFISKDKTDAGYWTFRIFVSVTSGGIATVSVPALGVKEPFPVSGEIQTGTVLGGAAYFLNGDGYNYLTDMDASQVIDLSSVNGYAAPSYALRTSLEYSTSATAIARLYGPGDTEGRPLKQGKDYTLSGGGPAIFHFNNDPENPVSIADQLVLTLKNDWTRENGKHRLLIVMDDGDAALPANFGSDIAMQASMDMKGITKTYPLILTEGRGGAGAYANSPDGIPESMDTTSGAFQAGGSIEIRAVAGTGYKFLRWEQTAGPSITLPEKTPGNITMTNAAVTLRAIYDDGTPPKSVISPSGVWTRDGEIKITATDDDPMKGTDVNPSGEGLGTVSAIEYRIKSGSQVIKKETVTSSIAAFTLEKDGAYEIEYRAVDAADNAEQYKTLNITRDSVPPSGEIEVAVGKIRTSYDEFASGPSFKLFYKNGTTVSLEAESKDPNIASVEYLILSTSGALHTLMPFKTKEAANAAPGWTTDEPPAMADGGKIIAYARMTDKAGNYAILNTDGIVKYADAGQVAQSVYAYRKDPADRLASATLNGNGVEKITDEGGKTLEKGKDYEVSEGGILFKGAWLGELTAKGTTKSAVDGYRLNIAYAPQGETYDPADYGGSTAPKGASIELDVLKAEADVSLSVSLSAATYDPSGDAALTAVVTNASFSGGENATGVVRFYDNLNDAYLLSGEKNSKAVDSSATSPSAADFVGQAEVIDGAARLNAVLFAGDRDADDLYAVYEGDGNYTDGAGELGKAYSVAKALRAAPLLTGAGVMPQDAGYRLETTYGKGPFSVTANLPEGESSAACGYRWDSSNDTAAVEVDPAGGPIYANLAGTHTVDVKTLADRNYEDSPPATLTLFVQKRKVIITGMAAANKVYDGTRTARPVTRGALLAPLPGAPDSGPLKEDVSDLGLLRISYDAGVAAFSGGGEPAYAGHPEYAGEDKNVTFSGFDIAGDRSGNYELATQPALAKANIEKASPTPAAMSTGTAVSYGTALSGSALSGRYGGVDGQELPGVISWTKPSSIPGADDTTAAAVGLNPSGYEYEVTFTPSSPASINYLTAGGKAKLTVSPAVATAPAVHGDTIFKNEYLSASKITGEVSFIYGGRKQTVEGDWAWDERVVSASAITGGAIGEGDLATMAAFTPSDRRIAPLQALVPFRVATPKTEITTPPSIASMPYGSVITNAAIGEGGAVLSISNDPNIASVDITAQGSFSLKESGSYIDLKGGTYPATLVFTPDNMNIGNGGYEPDEKSVTITVTAVSPAVATVGAAPAVTYGDLLSASDIAGVDPDNPENSGYVFSGVKFLDGEELPGTLSWVSPSAVVDAADGVYTGKAVFTPGAQYGKAYTPLAISVPVTVLAKPETIEALEESLAAATDAAVKVAGAEENYPSEAISRLNEATRKAEEGVAAGVSQNEADDLKRAVDAALAALKQDHRIISHSRPNGVTEDGQDVVLKIKGEFGGVTGVTFSGGTFVEKTVAIGAVSAGSKTLSVDGRRIGALTAGSAVVSLDAGFLDSLANGSYTVRLTFEDAYATGTGVATFDVKRPGPQPEQPTEEPAVAGVRITGAVTMFLYRAGGVGNSLALRAEVSAVNGAPASVSWSASGPAKVDDTGLVTFTGGEGATVITATSTFDASKSASVTVGVAKNVTAIRTPLTKVCIQRGKSLTLPVVLDDSSDPKSAVASQLVWKSSNEKALTVSNGKIRASKNVKKKTNVKVTVTAANGRSLTIGVTIAPKATKLKKVTTKFPKTMKAGTMYQLRVKLNKATATGVNVTFKSSKGSVVRVDRAGKLFALKKGVATITVTAGGKSVKKKVTVK
jgi:uncharacterized repeat protein (TIGR02543 family)